MFYLKLFLVLSMVAIVFVALGEYYLTEYKKLQERYTAELKRLNDESKRQNK